MSFTYDEKRLLELMNDFYSLTHIKTALYDNMFHYILGVPKDDSAFCLAVKKSADGLNNCDLCTKNAIQDVRKKNSLIIYHCHAGLVEAVAPIRISGVIVGYMMLGQILEKAELQTHKKTVMSRAARYTTADLNECIDALTVKSYAEVKAASKIMESCVCYLLMNHVIQENSGSIAFDINTYIKEHLSNGLTVKELCDTFAISRNMLYKISETYFGMPVAKYINLKRIEKAKQLIREGVPVVKVSEMTGFCDYVYFGKVFKRITGVTPRTFAKK